MLVYDDSRERSAMHPYFALPLGASFNYCFFGQFVSRLLPGPGAALAL